MKNYKVRISMKAIEHFHKKGGDRKILRDLFDEKVLVFCTMSGHNRTEAFKQIRR